MCWCFSLGTSNSKKRKSSSSGEKKRRSRPPADTLHGDGVPVVAEVQEKRRSRETPGKRRSGETVSTRSPRSPRHPREEHRPRQQYQYQDVYASREQYKPALNVQVPSMWHRSVDPESVNSSEEMLLNPRPHRSPHTRQRHPKRTSQTTLRGRGAKRDPPKHSKSKKNIRSENSGGWSFFAPTPPKTQTRRSDGYQNLDRSPRSQRSQPQRSSHQYQDIPESSRSQQRPHRSRQSDRQPSSARQNSAVRRDPDRRFAVLAATNQALEDLRREAFAQPSPPPRRDRLRRYQGVTIPSASIPFEWDCVSSSHTSAGYGAGYGGEPSSSRHRRSRR